MHRRPFRLGRANLLAAADYRRRRAYQLRPARPRSTLAQSRPSPDPFTPLKPRSVRASPKPALRQVTVSVRPLSESLHSMHFDSQRDSLKPPVVAANRADETRPGADEDAAGSAEAARGVMEVVGVGAEDSASPGARDGKAVETDAERMERLEVEVTLFSDFFVEVSDTGHSPAHNRRRSRLPSHLQLDDARASIRTLMAELHSANAKVPV
ncbi:hypothetical protein BDK51DRAFT_42273 [Blyttiomyces helicus]|uniref:Uncharacterized protein n=1 Tax=Blyttiomyces helicus TaxID=388810 RepID=A0A4P9W2R8_9FUNG|nr:hypothetical protein BDK51DRAFT_42273 [Blyttiomyces helicus]|eukprot:RKO85098.1 hypothetical protein BDK51DRAFT_42273 [Blyttiomyces helicus]